MHRSLLAAPLRQCRRIGILALALTSCLLAGRVAAGDMAERHIIGFSPDGRYFAFEQHGRQDGSGFPYADIFVIDTLRDAWVAGSPFRALIKDERARDTWARKQVLDQAAPLLKRLVIARPARLLASNPPTELSADPHRVQVNARIAPAASPKPWTFTLAEIPIATPRCADLLQGAAKGFRLRATGHGGTVRTLHDDTAIPKSRGCPVRYAISDVAGFARDGRVETFAVLVSVFAHGFEGPDRRFIAVTAPAR